MLTQVRRTETHRNDSWMFLVGYLEFSEEIARLLQHISFELSCNISIEDLKSLLFSLLLVHFPSFIVIDSSLKHL